MRHRIRHMIYVERAASSTLAIELASTSHITLVRNRGGSGELLGLRFTQLGLRFFFCEVVFLAQRSDTRVPSPSIFPPLQTTHSNRLHCWTIGKRGRRSVQLHIQPWVEDGTSGGRRLGGRFAAHASHRPRREGREDHHRVEEERGRCAHQGYKDRPCEEAGTIWNICLSPCVTWF